MLLGNRRRSLPLPAGTTTPCVQVFCDNFLDGGYHVPIAHKALAGSVDMASYRNRIFEHASVQAVQPGDMAGATPHTCRRNTPCT